jgi:hypothetical protein
MLPVFLALVTFKFETTFGKHLIYNVTAPASQPVHLSIDKGKQSGGGYEISAQFV